MLPNIALYSHQFVHGIFQIESESIQKMLNREKPEGNTSLIYSFLYFPASSFCFFKPSNISFTPSISPLSPWILSSNNAYLIISQ